MNGMRFAVAGMLFAWLAACSKAPEITDGVSQELAQFRAQAYSDLRYDLRFVIPASPAEPVLGEEAIRLTIRESGAPLVLDFVADSAQVSKVEVNGAPARYSLQHGHLVIAKEGLRKGENTIRIAFVAGDASLNRQAEFMYTLFVPDRASRAFPCFDQPDMKAIYRLELHIPDDWVAVANGEEQSVKSINGGKRYVFEPTKPLSTYLFAFAAGRFQIETAEIDGRTMRMFHRETDANRVRRNRDTIFQLHAQALKFLEEYTGIQYPFGKFDIVLIPSFQFGGMEHPGAILYRASSLMLTESATQSQKLGRANVIAHETAHMWFGDLVTMKWFNDVWMKEVFANFMAAKITRPAFPELDYELRFLLRHFPRAYSVDRTAGTHPIRQTLDNLNEAGTMYGAIIYQKAPIVLKQLETLIGEARFREGVREYLNQYAFANATWPDLVTILDRISPYDLQRWSRIWVEGAGRPEIEVNVAQQNDTIARAALVQRDPLGKNRVWPQRLRVVAGYPDSLVASTLMLEQTETAIEALAAHPAPGFILPNGGGLGYGLFVLDAGTRHYLLQHLPKLNPDLLRGAAWVDLWELMLNETIPPKPLLESGMAVIRQEREEMILSQVLNDVGTLFWRFLPDSLRQVVAPRLEEGIWSRLQRVKKRTMKATLLAAFRRVAFTQKGTQWLYDLWRRRERIAGLPLSERDETRLALELAVRLPEKAEAILKKQLGRINNPDRRKRLEFIMPALSAQQDVRDRFFERLKQVENRQQEPWVLEAVRYLHHPLRAKEAEKYIGPALDLVLEIQQTGDIFFPKRWLDATLSGHNSVAAAETVQRFLAVHAGYPHRLRLKILQSADGLFRASRIVHGWTGP
ncbi:MAG: M1 family aminopeptidase [candidate division KSB1 bacterium]|nr:M1 family aminopeptidase [candidate division KSB1 bacterium]MDQ7063438.1 M1 family aminopeptidase [candidate division KSB1 bacterium]